jgi:ClpP class serine protease
MLLPIFQILNRPWLIEESKAQYWADVAYKVLFQNQSFPADPNAHKPNEWGGEKRYAYRVDSTATRNPEGEVLVIEIKGPQMKNDFCGSPGMETLAQVVESATMDPTISSIIGRIDSPGGTVDGTHNLARAIARSPKATVAFGNGMMASAAYWIGSSFREVISDDANAGHNATIGSIGTKVSILDDRKAMEQKGYTVRQVYATKSKRKGAYMDEVYSGKDDRLQKELDAINDTFLADVKANRNGKLQLSLENVLEGDVYNAQDALRFGLIDKISNFRYAVKRSLQLAKTIRK